MSKPILVDTTAFLQGVLDAIEDVLTVNEVQKICSRVRDISRPGASGRDVCLHYELVGAVLTWLDLSPTKLARLWEYIGKSLASGIRTAAGNREGEK